MNNPQGFEMERKPEDRLGREAHEDQVE